MSYTLYLANNCHDCDRVLDELKNSGISFEHHNVDEGGKEPPIYMHVFPCLFKEDELVAVGDDILIYFEVEAS